MYSHGPDAYLMQELELESDKILKHYANHALLLE